VKNKSEEKFNGVDVGERACANFLNVCAVVELLEEKGVLTQEEVFARYKSLLEKTKQGDSMIQ